MDATSGAEVKGLLELQNLHRRSLLLRSATRNLGRTWEFLWVFSFVALGCVLLVVCQRAGEFMVPAITFGFVVFASLVAQVHALHARVDAVIELLDLNERVDPRAEAAPGAVGRKRSQ